MHRQSTPMQPALFPAEKRCNGPCEASWPLDQFPPDKRSRDGHTGLCRICTRAYMRAYYAARAERMRPAAAERQRAYYASHRQDINARQRDKYWADPEKARERVRLYCQDHLRERSAYARLWHMRNPEKAREQARRHREAHPDLFKSYYAKNAEKLRERGRLYSAAHLAEKAAYARQWRLDHPEQARAQSERAYKRHRLMYVRNARLRRARLAGAPGTHTTADLDVIRSAQRGRCAYCLTPLVKPVHVDHMTPVSRGGCNWPYNLALSCQPCNNKKFTLTAGQFFARLIKEGR